MTAALDGLTSAEVAERVADGRTNADTRHSSRSGWAIVKHNVLTRFNAIIGALTVVMLAFGRPQDALFGLAAVANTAVGVIQELRAKRTLDRLSLVGSARPRVRRDGGVTAVRQDEVVADDMVELGTGDTLVVDGEVLSADGLEVDESLLTGEADPVRPGSGDRVLSGSFVVAGHGSYRATGVGPEAYAARLAAQASRFELVRSPLRQGIDRFLWIIQWLLLPAAALLTVSQLLTSESFTDALAGTVAGVVTMVPEGLVLLTSVAFAAGVIRLARRHTLVQELAAVEGLARVDVICLDKTGTLTEDMTVLREVRPLDGAAPVDAALGALAAAEEYPNASLRAIAAGRPAAADGWRTESSVPFSSARKWSSVTVADHGTWLLGAPEVLLTDPDSAALREVAAMAASGQRVLLLATAPDRPPLVAGGAAALPAGVRPVALVGLEQRIRADAAETLRFFAEQDVAVKVISGDNPRTVGAVASALGVPGAGDPVDARDLPDDPVALADVMERRSVFGRTAPEQKRAMVAALQSRGHVVAMTGDGVNDVLALKDADLGVAMGSGSDAARSVARVVLLDNRFSSLPKVLAEGRRVAGNVERVANLFLTKTFYALVLALAIGVARLPFPFLPRHIMVIGTLTIGVPAFFLALAPNTERARPGFVPRVLRFAVPAGVLAAAASFAAYASARAHVASDLPADRTTATIALFLVATYVLLLVARPLVAWKLVMVGATVAGFVAVLTVPVLQRFFALRPVSVVNDLVGLGVATAACAVLYVVLRVLHAVPSGHPAPAAATGSRPARMA